MQKYTTHTAIIVQNKDENAFYYSERINNEINSITEKLGGQLTSPPLVMMTSASDGRQTATIQFFSSLPSKEETLFPTNMIITALENYDENEHPEVIKFANWLMSQKKSGYIFKPV